MDSFDIQLSNIHKSYQEGDATHHVLSDLNLHIEAGKKIAILGRSGSGKTTLLNILSAITQPDEGEYFAFGQAVHTFNEKQAILFRRYYIGYIFQYYNLIPSLTARENIEFVLKITKKEKNMDKALQFCKAIGIEHCLDKLVPHLSGGEQQRVAIIRALAPGSKLILADEPTGNLDQVTGDQVAQCLFETIDAFEATLVLVTHSPQLALGSDIQYDLWQGQFVQRGL